jgi:hypothetical protein
LAHSHDLRGRKRRLRAGVAANRTGVPRGPYFELPKLLNDVDGWAWLRCKINWNQHFTKVQPQQDRIELIASAVFDAVTFNVFTG